jgi:hypothetical protein
VPEMPPYYRNEMGRTESSKISATSTGERDKEKGKLLLLIEQKRTEKSESQLNQPEGFVPAKCS